jgi:hypothetical protein
MREIRSSGSLRGAGRETRPYRDSKKKREQVIALLGFTLCSESERSRTLPMGDRWE